MCHPKRNKSVANFSFNDLRSFIYLWRLHNFKIKLPIHSKQFEIEGRHPLIRKVQAYFILKQISFHIETLIVFYFNETFH